MAPEPTTSSVLGKAGGFMASREVQTRSPSATRPIAGMALARPPTARITALAWTVREPPAFSATTALGAGSPGSSLALPATTSIRFFFIR